MDFLKDLPRRLSIGSLTGKEKVIKVVDSSQDAGSHRRGSAPPSLLSMLTPRRRSWGDLIGQSTKDESRVINVMPSDPKSPGDNDPLSPPTSRRASAPPALLGLLYPIGTKPADPALKRRPRRADSTSSLCSVTSDPTRDDSLDMSMSKLKMLKRQLRGREMSIDDLELYPTVGVGSFGRVRMVRLKDHCIQTGALKGERAVLALKMINKLKAQRNMGTLNLAIDSVRQEISILACLEFPFIVNMLTYFQDTKRVCLLMEFVYAGELFKFVYRDIGKPMPVEVSVHFSAELLATLHLLHEKKILYRDLKLENVLIDSKGHAKVVDFGLAKQCTDENLRSTTNCGTLSYQAPEMLLNKEYGPGVDYWAWGCLLFELLAKAAPWGKKRDPFEISQAIMSLNIKWVGGMDKSGKQLVSKMLVHDVATRWGGSTKNPPSLISSHKFYQYVDWDELVIGRCKSPVQPNISDALDVSQYEDYPESVEALNPEMNQLNRSKWLNALQNLW